MQQSKGDGGRHPMQPLCPKKQPWVMAKAPAIERSPMPSRQASANSNTATVEEELLLRLRIEERAMQKVEKRHNAVDLDRHARKLQRQKPSGDAGKIIKSLLEQESKRSLSLGGSSPSE